MTERLSTRELNSLSRILDELDYYELLEIERSASPAQVKQAYYTSARSFHPAGLRKSDESTEDASETIRKRATEAYCVLRDPRRRAAYDDHLAKTGEVRMQLAAAREASHPLAPTTRGGHTPQGRQFFQRALREAEHGNLKAALQTVQIALTFEPQNTGFAEQRDQWKAIA
jgi:DnaJ-class molecular chaperone